MRRADLVIVEDAVGVLARVPVLPERQLRHRRVKVLLDELPACAVLAALRYNGLPCCCQGLIMLRASSPSCFGACTYMQLLCLSPDINMLSSSMS